MGPWNQASRASWASMAARAFVDAFERWMVSERDGPPAEALGGISGDGRAPEKGSACETSH